MKRKQLYSLLEEEYTTHNDREDDEMYWTREALKNELNDVERKIYITYLENETYAATAKLFKVSTPTVCKYIKGLQNRIIDYVCNHLQ